MASLNSFPVWITDSPGLIEATDPTEAIGVSDAAAAFPAIPFFADPLDDENPAPETPPIMEIFFPFGANSGLVA
jgi:hypothetical protein